LRERERERERAYFKGTQHVTSGRYLSTESWCAGCEGVYPRCSQSKGLINCTAGCLYPTELREARRMTYCLGGEEKSTSSSHVLAIMTGKNIRFNRLVIELQQATYKFSGIKVKDKIISRSTVSRPVCSGVRPTSGSRDQFFFHFHGNYLQTVWVCYYGASSLTRGRFCNLQLLLDLATPHLKGQVPIFIPHRSRVAQLFLRGHCSLFVVSYDSQDYGGGILTRLHPGSTMSLHIVQ
jgi:hypothetical protein